MCRRLGISRASYYRWLDAGESPTALRHLELTEQVKARLGPTVCCSGAPTTRSPGTQPNLLTEVFATDEATGKLLAVWKVKDQLRMLLRANSLADASAKEDLKVLVDAAGRPETNKLYRTVCRCWNEIEVLIVTGATTGKLEANSTGIKHIKRTAGGYRNLPITNRLFSFEVPRGRQHDTHPGIHFPTNRE